MGVGGPCSCGSAGGGADSEAGAAAGKGGLEVEYRGGVQRQSDPCGRGPCDDKQQQQKGQQQHQSVSTKEQGQQQDPPRQGQQLTRQVAGGGPLQVAIPVPPAGTAMTDWISLVSCGGYRDQEEITVAFC